MDKKYNSLLNKFAGNDELIELINLCIIDDARLREIVYLKKSAYPDRRDLLGKLKTDIMLKRVELTQKNKNNL